MTRKPATGSDAADEPFVSRWSRRKHAAREQQETPGDHGPDAARAEPAEGGPAPAAETVEEGPASAPAHDDADLPTDADMPPLESLDADSDYSGFMSPRVSETLRRMALRKLFGLPTFNVRDGLDDYDVDYTNFQPLGATVTADMKHHAERRRARQAEADAETERDARDVPSSGDEEIDVAAADTDAGSDEGQEERREPHDETPEGPESGSGDDEAGDDER